MKRIKYTDVFDERLKETLKQRRRRGVIKAAKALDDVLGAYNRPTTKRNSFLHKVTIGKSETKLHEGFCDICSYLESLRGDNNNPIEHLLEDYYMCIFDYFARYGRTPFFRQTLPTPINQVRFEEWIQALEDDITPDAYFSADFPGWEELKKKAAKKVARIADKRDKLKKTTDNVDIIEV